MWQGIAGPKPLWYWILTLLVGAAALAAYLIADRERKEIRWSIARVQAASGACAQGYLEPERWSPLYTERELNAYRVCAASAPLRSYVEGRAGQRSALEHYRARVLGGSDLFYAVFLGAFSCLFAIGMIRVLPTLPLVGPLVAPYAAPIMLVCAANGLLYAAFDLAEDRRLAALLGQELPVSAEQARVASMLSGAKIGTIGLSIWGVGAHVAFGLAGRLVNGPDPR